MISRSRERFCDGVARLRDTAAQALGGRQDGGARTPGETGHGGAGAGRVFEFTPDARLDGAALADCAEVYRAASTLCHALSAAALTLVDLDAPLDGSSEASKALIRAAARQLVESFVDVKAKEYGFIRESDNVDSSAAAVLLEQAFAVSATPNPAEVEVLGWATRMGERRVAEWFARKADRVKQLSFLREAVQAGLAESCADGGAGTNAPTTTKRRG